MQGAVNDGPDVATGAASVVDIGVDVGQSGVRARVRGPAQTQDLRLPGGHHRRAMGDLAAALRRIAPGRVDRLAIGATGVHGHADRFDVSPLIERLRPAQVIVTDDAVTAYLGALGSCAGTVAAVGTGIVVLARAADGRMHRLGGHGLDIDDRGSGAWIGRSALQSAIDQHEGVRRDAGSIEELCRAQLGGLHDLPWRASDPEWSSTLATLCAPLTALAAAGDAAAQAIMAEAGEQIGIRIAAAMMRAGHDREQPVALTGGVAAALPHLEPGLRRSLPAGVRIVAPAGDPLDGAMRLLDAATMPYESPLVARIHGGAGSPPAGALVQEER
ncbi:BadF/BadG/BcrA/BcrD ATPase family protein [Microbacterium sp.]|uniref:BadF/BadG/BcrA/BcrD ATPase family protein n=1 Tax=Microbacterium sp. TaxID=51671 RepID=UPI002810F076|nr:BadF/BadG/BcrA/BcrD ATPase family protein [Microbacterium sp.]